MQISEIKTRLSIDTVLSHYSLTPDRNQRLKCPFHDDKTPSMQVYPKTGTWTCFSSNCSAGSGDQIDFIMKREDCTKHEAILKAKDLLGVATTPPETESFTKTAVLTKIFGTFQNGMQRSVVGRQYLESRGLDPDRLEVGYNSGQYHHNGRVNDRLMASYVKYGLLKPGVKGGHQVFGKGCICFALKNQTDQVTGLYFRSTMEANGDGNHARHFYLKDRQGLYPGYPAPDTTKLILAEAVIDAATLLQEEEIVKEYGILALYGTNGLTEEHKRAIQGLNKLEETILFFDGDAAGKEALKKHSESLQELKPGIRISYVETPDGEDVNSLTVAHESGILTHLIESRQVFSFSSTEKKKGADPGRPAAISAASQLDIANPYNIRYRGEIARHV